MPATDGVAHSASERVVDRPSLRSGDDHAQLNRALIQQAAGVILALRWAADGMAAFLLLACYPLGHDPTSARVAKLLFGVHALFSGVAWTRYRRGAVTDVLVTGDVLITTGTMLAAAHYAEGVFSPILYLLLVQLASFVVIFGPHVGRTAALAAAIGVLVQAVCDAFGLGAPLMHTPVVPRLLDFGTMLAASALLLIGITRTMRWVRAKEQELRRETERAQAAAAFQAELAELALAALTEERLEPALALMAERARPLLACDGVRISLVDGETLASVALSPAIDDVVWTSGPLTHDLSWSAAAARTRRPAVGTVPPSMPGEVPPALLARRPSRVLAVPLIGRSGRLLGTLACIDDGGARDVAAWQVRAGLLAAQATAAVERAELVGRLQDEARRVRALLRVSQEIGAGATYGDLAARICTVTRELLGADRVALVRSEDDGTRRGDDPPSADVEEARAVRAAIAQDPDDIPSPYREAKRDGRLIVAPLGQAGRLYGLLTARRTTTPGRFDGAQIALLEGIARQAAMALDNLRLLEEERNAATLANTLLEVARELNVVLDAKTLLARLGERAVALTGAAAGMIALWRPREGVYRVEAAHGAGDGLRDVELGGDAYERDADRMRLGAAWVERLAAAAGVTVATATETSIALERGGETAGVLTLLWRPGATPAPEQLALARGLVHQAAIALQNARLLDDVREASRLKSEFVATMSHELRTPLNVILGYLNLFLDDAFGELVGEQRTILGRMQRSGTELLDLITATLDLNRLEAGRSRVVVEPVTLPDLFAQLEAETVSPEPTGVELRWVVASDLPALETDRAKLRIVLKNLVGNAMKFTERGSVTVAAAPAADGVEFTVSDTGVGIRREDLPVIFEMFRQAESANTRRHGGVGLGLYIVKRLLSELRGEIDVESEVGAGSRFRVKLPVRLQVAPK